MDRRRLDFFASSEPDVEHIWRTLEIQGQPCYFLSWGWMSTWLAALPADQRPALAVMHDGRAPTAAFFLAQRRVRRNLVLQANALYFNATGVARHDDVGLAHNGLLAAPGARRSLAHVLDLLPDSWDELHLPAVDRNAFDDLGAASALANRYKVRLEREELAPFVDLANVRAVGYDALLAVNSRACLQRSRDRLGDVRVEIASDRHHALDIYGELLRLHAREAAAQRRRGAFADAWVEAFHRRLVLDRLPHGEIQLVRVTRGGATLGCLYNFVHRGRVIAYQGGFADPASVALCHANAIDHNAAVGHATYAVPDESLATGADRLVWLRVHRPAAWVSIEDAAKRWYDALVGERRQLTLA